jgi:hypothetical protein
MKIMRLVAVLAVVAGVVLTASGPATVTSPLPYFTIQSNLGYGIFAAWAWRSRWATWPSRWSGA